MFEQAHRPTVTYGFGSGAAWVAGAAVACAAGILALRSAFWLGAVMRPDLPGALGDLAGRLINRPLVRRRLVEQGLPQALSLHCAQEYANMATLLPELYSRFA